MRTVHTKAHDAPTMVLITSIKGAAPGLKVGHPLVLYGEDGKYTSETEGIYYAE
jgi:tRNA1(Val) A37 N6-methylase TrmN6